ncbi:unnamed protein product [Phaeothamnion confervicola]
MHIAFLTSEDQRRPLSIRTPRDGLEDSPAAPGRHLVHILGACRGRLGQLRRLEGCKGGAPACKAALYLGREAAWLVPFWHHVTATRNGVTRPRSRAATAADVFDDVAERSAGFAICVSANSAWQRQAEGTGAIRIRSEHVFMLKVA